MNTYFALFVIATMASLIITPVVRRLCERYRLLDVPTDSRRLHTQATPRLGGVAGGIHHIVLDEEDVADVDDAKQDDDEEEDDHRHLDERRAATT